MDSFHKTKMNYEVNNFETLEEAQLWASEHLLLANPYINLVGNTFGKLKVLQVAGTKVIGKSQQKRVHYICKCDCGVYSIVDIGKLYSGHTISCGCHQKSQTKKEMMKRIINLRKDLPNKLNLLGFSMVEDFPEDMVGLWDTKAKFICNKCNNIFSRAYGKIATMLLGCPNCAGLGFNQTQPAYLCVMKIINTDYIKYGISNNPLRRKRELENINCRDFILLKTFYFEKGTEAQEIELLLKQKLQHIEGLLLSGSTETAKESEFVIELERLGYRL